MKKKLILIVTILSSIFMFTTKTSAITALCKYEASDGSKAYVILENYKKYLFFEHFDLLSVDDTAQLGALTPMSSILGIATLINYFPTINSGSDGMSLYFDGTYDSVTVESFMSDTLETKFDVHWVNSSGNPDPVVKQNFKNGDRCPDVMFYDGDSALTIESAEISFANAQTSEMSDAPWANNKVYTKQVDLVTDNYKSDSTISMLRNINNALDGNGCGSPLSGSQESMDNAIAYLSLNVAYGDLTGSEKHFLAKAINYGSSPNSSDSLGYSYRELAQKIENNPNADTTVSNACGVDATGLRQAAKIYNHAYEVTSDFGADDVQDCEGVIGDPNEEGTFAYYLQIMLDFVQYGGVALVIVLTTIELIKAVTSSDKDEVNKVMSKTLTRVIAMILLFIVPILVNLILNIFHIYGNCGIK